MHHATGLFDLGGVGEGEAGIFEDDVRVLRLPGNTKAGLRMVQRVIELSAELDVDVLPEFGRLEEAEVQLVNRNRASVLRGMSPNGLPKMRAAPGPLRM